MKGKKTYFASDFHLGLYPEEDSKRREKIIVNWLDSIKNQADSVFLVGDIFDYWFEYKRVVPRGFTRFLGKISEFTDSGIEVHFFIGNHDIWTFDYLEKETGMIIHKKPFTTKINNKKLFIAHGDGLGPGDISYKILKSIFHNKTLQWLYSRLHPNFNMWLGQTWSKKSRYGKGLEEKFFGEDKELLFKFARKKLKEEHFDYFIFGHRHYPILKEISKKSEICYLGDWIKNFTFGILDDEGFKQEKFLPVI